MCMKQEREMLVMWSEKVRFWSKITHRLRTGEFVINLCVGAESVLTKIERSGILLSWSRRPMRMNSVLVGFRH